MIIRIHKHYQFRLCLLFAAFGFATLAMPLVAHAENAGPETVAADQFIVSEHTVLTYIMNHVATVGDFARSANSSSPDGGEFNSMPLVWGGQLKVAMFGDGMPRFGELIETTIGRYGAVAGIPFERAETAANIIVLADQDPFAKAVLPEYSRIFSALTGRNQASWGSVAERGLAKNEVCQYWVGMNSNYNISGAYLIVDTSITDEAIRNCINKAMPALFGIRYVADGKLEASKNPVMDYLAIWTLYGFDDKRPLAEQLSGPQLLKRIGARLAKFSAVRSYFQASLTPAAALRNVSGFEDAQEPLLVGWAMPLRVRVLEEQLFRYGQSIVSQIEGFAASGKLPVSITEQQENVLVVALPDMSERISAPPYKNALRDFFGNELALDRRMKIIQENKMDCWAEYLGSNDGVNKSILMVQTNVNPETVRACVQGAVPILFGYSSYGANQRKEIGKIVPLPLLELIAAQVATTIPNQNGVNVKAMSQIDAALNAALGDPLSDFFNGSRVVEHTEVN